MKQLERWTGIALINLTIVALLGLTLRTKMVLPIPFIEFKFVLHAHSHFAFGGWVTLALLSLMTFQILPEKFYSKPIYKWLFIGILIASYGMLLSFPFQGYAFYSILFSTLLIFVTYGFTIVFIRDIVKTEATKSVKILSISAVAYMALSSVGAFTLAYLFATKSENVFLYKDAIYTYLHLQYSGFFTLAVFALMLHYLKAENKHTKRFAQLMSMSVLPSMFISYLWHYPGAIISIIAIAGSLLIVLSAVWFFIMLRSIYSSSILLKTAAKNIVAIAMVSFVLKMIFQALTIIPSLGPLVFANRPVVIGFLHLVLLGFVSLYLLAHFIQTSLLAYKRFSGFAIWLFITGIVINEVVLFIQGLGFMLMVSSSLVNWLLLGAAVCLFSGALLIAISKWKFSRSFNLNYNQLKTFKSFSQS